MTVVVPVTADPASDVSGKRSVVVTVTDANDDGKATISKREPQVGTVVSATLDDKDADITRRAWQWYRGGASDAAADTLAGLGHDADAVTNDVCDDNGNADDASDTAPCVIGGATSPTYSVNAKDKGLLIQVVVTYRDKHTDTEADPIEPYMVVGRPARDVQDIPAANTAPEFGVQDPVIDGDETEHVMREVDENEKVDVGMFSATDGDLLDYTLGGADMALFKLSAPSGESNEITLQMKEKLDFENPKDADGDNGYEVSITAEDPSGATATIMVTIMVQNVEDAPTITLQSASECELDDDIVKCTYVENGPGPVAHLSASDDEGDAFTWSLEADAHERLQEVRHQ